MKARLGAAPVHRVVQSALAVAAILVFGGVVHADAPSDQYLTFGTGDLCITDRFTMLTWTRRPITDPLSFGQAASFCATLEDGGDVWRLPSVNELETLVDENPHYAPNPNGGFVLTAIDVYAFPDTPVTDPYWTSSVVPGSQTAWAVNFQDGSTLAPPQSAPGEVRCVIVTPATGPMPSFCQ